MGLVQRWGRSKRRWGGASKIVFFSFDILLAKILSRLHFDNGEVFHARVTNAVPTAFRYLDRLTGKHAHFFVVLNHHRFPLEDEPMFGTMAMALQAETFSGIHHQSFDLVVRFVGKHDIISPRPVFFPTGLNDDAFIDVEQRVDHVEQGSGLQHAISACFAVEADDLFESRHRGFGMDELRSGNAFDDDIAMAVIDGQYGNASRHGIE